MIATSKSTFLLSELTDQTVLQRDNVSLCLVEHKHSENEISLPSHTRCDLGTEVSWTYAHCVIKMNATVCYGAIEYRESTGSAVQEYDGKSLSRADLP